MTTRRTSKCQHGRCKHEASTVCRHCKRNVCWRHYVDRSSDKREPWAGCRECDEKQRAQFTKKGPES